MNLNLVKRNKTFFINLFISLVVLFFIYSLIYSKYSTEYNDRKKTYTRFHDISMKLEDFVKIETNINEQKDKINEITSLYDNYFMSNDEIVNAYKSLIIKLFKETDIPIKEEAITQIPESENNVLLLLKFDAPYEQYYKFLFEIERFSSVSNITMTRSGEITMECRPYLYSLPVNDFFSGRQTQKIDDVSLNGYFEEVSGKIFSTIDVGHIPTLRDLLPVPRNPFYNGLIVDKGVDSAKKSKDIVYRRLPEIILDGIMYEEKNPIVIIEGNLYHKGQMYGKMKILKINQNSINVEYYGKVYTIKMLN